MKRLYDMIMDSDAFWSTMFLFCMCLMGGVAAMVVVTAGVLVVEYIEWFHQLIRG